MKPASRLFWCNCHRLLRLCLLAAGTGFLIKKGMRLPTEIMSERQPESIPELENAIIYCRTCQALIHFCYVARSGTTEPTGTFAGVFTPTAITILGVIMYLRMGWVVGNAGLIGAGLHHRFSAADSCNGSTVVVLHCDKHLHPYAEAIPSFSVHLAWRPVCKC